jgi:hypothetical protein
MKLRREEGNSLVELPVLLFVVFVVLAFPLTGLATLSYRAALFFIATRSACVEASRARSFTDAQTAAQATVTSGCSAFNGVLLKNCQVSIVTRDVLTGAEHVSEAVLPADTIDTLKHVYFIRVATDARLSPLLPAEHTYLGLSIPGLTKQFNFSAASELFAERPIGLAF